VRTTTLLAAAALAVCGIAFLTSAQSQQAPAPPASPAAQHRRLLDTYCVGCHNERLKTADLMLDRMNLNDVAQNGAVWEKVIRKLEGGQMPPQGMPRPPAEAVSGLVAFLKTTLDEAALANADPGRAPIHRLNRTEYANAVRDLLAVEIDPAEFLPPDDESDGFDNIADALRVSPTLIDQYLAASRKIAELAVGDMDITPVSRVIQVPPDRSQERHIEGLPLGTRGGVLIHHNFPLDAEYDFHVFLLQNIVGYVTGLEYAHDLEIAIDGQRVFLTPVGGEEDNLLSDANLGVAKDTLDARLKARIPVSAGRHAVSVAFVMRNSAASDEPLQPFTRDLDLQNMNGLPIVDHVQITGPFHASGPGDTASRRRIFTCRPGNGVDEVTCARQILSDLAHRAYRRPVDSGDLEKLLSFYQAGRNNGDFEDGIQNALRLILANPKFLFRAETNPDGLPAGAKYRISDIELASRLSFFLWSSIPDDELLRMAEQNRLHEPAVLEQQVKRMLADPKSDALVKNFAGQWLLLRNLQSQTRDQNLFPNFDDNLRQALRTETEMFFASIMREDRNVVDLLTADYTFVNERLARHYGIPNVYGSHFRRVKVTDPARQGLLGHGSFLTVTSEPNRTSPVKRGKWILETVLGTPPPPPPPNVPALKENDESGKNAETLRARLEVHRANEPCRSCHRLMDPLGLALENFDAVGRWRTKEPGGQIDAAGQLADGTVVDGPVALRQAILKHPEQFVNTMVEKMLIYALGRGLEHFDMPVVRSITRQAGPDYRFSKLVLGIVASTPFQMRRVQEPAAR
jgi:mono/diheme cytochrome c family protein